MFTIWTTRSNWMICCLEEMQLAQVALMVVRIPVLALKMRWHACSHWREQWKQMLWKWWRQLWWYTSLWRNNTNWTVLFLNNHESCKMERDLMNLLWPYAIDLTYQNVISRVGLQTYSRWAQALPHFQCKVVIRVPSTLRENNWSHNASHVT
jgi:hypothetical protein